MPWLTVAACSASASREAKTLHPGSVSLLIVESSASRVPQRTDSSNFQRDSLIPSSIRAIVRSISSELIIKLINQADSFVVLVILDHRCEIIKICTNVRFHFVFIFIQRTLGITIL